MIIPNHELVPFLAHKDSIVRDKIAMYFEKNIIKNLEIIKYIFKSIDLFGTEDNIPLIKLLGIQDLSLEQIRRLFNLWENLRHDSKYSNSTFFIQLTFLEISLEKWKMLDSRKLNRQN